MREGYDRHLYYRVVYNQVRLSMDAAVCTVLLGCSSPDDATFCLSKYFIYEYYHCVCHLSVNCAVLYTVFFALRSCIRTFVCFETQLLLLLQSLSRGYLPCWLMLLYGIHFFVALTAVHCLVDLAVMMWWCDDDIIDDWWTANESVRTSSPSSISAVRTNAGSNAEQPYLEARAAWSQK